jgi:hypothetical protein
VTAYMPLFGACCCPVEVACDICTTVHDIYVANPTFLCDYCKNFCATVTFRSAFLTYCPDDGTVLTDIVFQVFFVPSTGACMWAASVDSGNCVYNIGIYPDNSPNGYVLQFFSDNTFTVPTTTTVPATSFTCSPAQVIFLLVGGPCPGFPPPAPYPYANVGCYMDITLNECPP